MLRHLLQLETTGRVRCVIAAATLSAIRSAGQSILHAPQASAEAMETTVQRVGLEIEYPVTAGPLNVAWESPGRAWFVAPQSNMVGVITRGSDFNDDLIYVNVNFIALPTGSRPYDVAYADSTVWFTENGANKLGRIDVVSAPPIITAPTKEYPLPAAACAPSGIAIAPSSAIWLVCADMPLLIRFDPATETFSEHSYAALLLAGDSVSTVATLPDIAVQDSNEIWFTVPGSDIAGVYEVDLVKFSKIPMSTPRFKAEEPASITVDAQGLPWITSYKTNVIGRYAPGTLALWRWYEVPTADSGPRGIAIRDTGPLWDVWFTEEKANKVGRLTVRAQDAGLVELVEYPQSASSAPRGIAVGGDDTVWFAELRSSHHH